MSEIVYSELDDIAELNSVTWKMPGEQTYKAAGSQMDPARGFSVIGRRDKFGQVSVRMVRENRSDTWKDVNQWHVKLAVAFEKFFNSRIAMQPGNIIEGDYPTFLFTEDERFAAKQLMAVEGDNDEDAARAINAKLAAFGIPTGDWTFVQLLRAASCNTGQPNKK